MNWLLNPSAHFESTFSTPDSFQAQILTEVYDKTRVNRWKDAEFRFMLVSFVPFSIFFVCIGVGHVAVMIRKLGDFLRVMKLFLVN